jgi:hypothetical protein
MYRNSWPLLALATYKQLVERTLKANGHINGHPIELKERHDHAPRH